MTETLLALLPDYGIYVVAMIVFAGALGIPLPSSIVVLTSGSLAATGDLALSPLFIATLGAFLLGDQLAYFIGQKAGSNWLHSLKKHKKVAAAVERSESLYQRYGLLAILLSRTVISPCGPYLAYLSGIWNMSRIKFSVVAAVGVALWVSFYLGLGYLFAGKAPEVSDLIASALMVGIAAVAALGFALWLLYSWRHFEVSTA